jgi:hypothetical protein
MLEIGGQPVTVVVEREQLEGLVGYGYPAERTVYMTTWNNLQIDDTRRPSGYRRSGSPSSSRSSRG